MLLRKLQVSLSDNGCDLPTQRVFKDSGAMIAPATIARTGIMNYSAGQLGKLFSDLPPTQVVKVMTTAEELFCKDSIESYHSSPITILHPDDDVDVDNASELQHGHIVGLPFRDGDNLKAHIVLSDRAALDAIEQGMEQLSSGHGAQLIRLSDEEAKRVGYHAIKTAIRNNHVAIVPSGRAGNARIADSAELLEEEVDEAVLPENGSEGSNEPEGSDKTNLEQKLKDAEELHETTTAKLHDAEAKLEAANTELETLKAEVTRLSDQLAGDEHKASVKQQVRDALDFLATASQFTNKDLVGMEPIEAKRVILQDHTGKDMSDRSDTYINARYEILLEDADNGDNSAISTALKDNLSFDPTPAARPSKSDEARQRMVNRNSHK